jgi:hypothetical protein
MTKPGLVPWCEWQVPASDCEGFACMASSASGHVFECTYREDGHWILDAKGKRKKPQHPSQKPGRYEGICEDYKPPEKE